MVDPTRIPERQLDLGAAAYLKVVPESPPGNQVEVTAGFLYAGGFAIRDQFSGGNQTTPGFAPVAAAMQRYDLVYLDNTGAASVQAGTEVGFGSPVFQGAPGFTAGPDLVDQAIPVAYVFVDETGAVVVDSTDITLLGGQFQVTRDLEGYLVDKGLFGGAPAGASDDVSALFAAETPGGGTAVRGVVTTAPLNYVTVVDQNGDEILHNTGARMFGRLTEAAGTWTLTYLYVDAAGAEQSMDPSADTAGVAPTDIRLIGTPKVYSRNDPARPLFSSSVARLSDQLAGDIPYATEAAPGKVQLAADGDTAAGEAVQGDDARVNTPIQAQDSGGAAIGTRFSHLREGTDISLTDLGGNILEIASASGVGSNFFITPVTTLAAIGGTVNISGALGFTPKLAIFVFTGGTAGDDFGVGMAKDAIGANQRYATDLKGGVSGSGTGSVFNDTGAAITYTVSTFDATGVFLTHAGATAPATKVFALIL